MGGRGGNPSRASQLSGNEQEVYRKRIPMMSRNQTQEEEFLSILRDCDLARFLPFAVSAASHTEGSNLFAHRRSIAYVILGRITYAP